VKAEDREIHMDLKERQRTSLASCRVSPGADVTFITQKTWVAVSNMVHATDFYERKLGLAPTEDESDGSRVYACGGGTSLHLHASRALAGRAASTLATWYVADLEQVVGALTSNGVVFEQCDEPTIKTNAEGIAATSDGKIAWFKDPDGNTFAVEE
jgi:catechol 2,3-dioxygenase-like lactoylglutathione lyase family enzyme